MMLALMGLVLVGVTWILVTALLMVVPNIGSLNPWLVAFATLIAVGILGTMWLDWLRDLKKALSETRRRAGGRVSMTNHFHYGNGP